MSGHNGKTIRLPFASPRAELEAISAKQAAWRIKIRCQGSKSIGQAARYIRLACLISDAEKYRVALSRAIERKKKLC